MVNVREHRIAALKRSRLLRVKYLRDALAQRQSATSRAWRRYHADEARGDIARLRILDAKIAQLERVPSDVRTTILELCQRIDQGSTSALFGRIHDVRKWVEKR
jgi:hypothetical protein